MPSRSSSESRRSCSSRPRRAGPGILSFSALALLPGLALLSSCADEDPAREIDACIEQSIAQGRTANWTQGVWRIEGSGERESCSDEVLDTDDFQLGSEALRVHQQGHYLFLENPSLHPGFSLSGMVGDRCIHIKTTEKTAYGTVRYDLPARFLGTSSFSGTFRSSGPGACEGKGEFSAWVKLDPVPATASNPAPPDAGVPTDMLCKSCKAGCDEIEPEYVSDCQKSCEQYVCRTPIDAGPDADAGDSAEADAADAQDDAADAQDDAAEASDDAADAQDDAAVVESGEVDGDTGAPDVETDSLEDGEAGDASEDGSDDAADGGAGDAEVTDGEVQDAVADAAEAGQADSGGPVYVLWDGAVELDEEDLEDATDGCSVSAAGRTPSTFWVAISLAAGTGGWRRRRRAGR